MEKIIKPRIFDKYSEVVAGITTKHYKPLDFRLAEPAEVKAARKRLFKDLDLSYEQVVTMKQVHGKNVREVTQKEIGHGHKSFKRGLAKTDGCYTKLTDVPLATIVADCVPILLYAPGQKIVAVVHSGWQGTAKGVLEQALKALIKEEEVKTKNLKAYLGPAIGACCYKIDGEEDEENRIEILKRKLKNPKVFKDLGQGLIGFDNRRANYYILKEWGVPTKNIEISSYCTACEKDLASHWREGKRRETSNLAVIAQK